jgi:hypothetical protein
MIERISKNDKIVSRYMSVSRITIHGRPRQTPV